MRDLLYAARLFAKSPGFTLLAILTLALGVGANAAIFSLVNAVLLRSFPMADASRLAYVWTPNDRLKAPVPRELSPEMPDFLELRRLNRSFTHLTAFSQDRFRVDNAEYIGGATVTGDFFQTMGAEPQLGRVFTAEDDQPGRPGVAVISDALWHSKYAGAGDVLGKTISISGKKATIVAVMPAAFTFPKRSEVPYGGKIERTDIWTPFAAPPKILQSWNIDGAIGRLAPGVSMKQADAEIKALMVPLDKKHTDLPGFTGWVSPFVDTVVGPVRPLVWMLFGAVSLVLLIACGNVANLLTARAAGRAHELGVRSAMGAERGRLIRQMITEAMLLAILGGAVGVALAYAGVRLLLLVNPGDIPRIGEMSVDVRVLAFSVGISLLTGFLSGLLPALSASRIDVMSLLKQGGSKGAAGTSNKLRHVLIVAEVALSVVLLAGAGLLIRSFLNLQKEGPGFSGAVVTMQLYSGDARPDTFNQYRERLRRTVERVSALPGVTAAGIVSDLPLSDADSVTFLKVDGYDNQPDQTVNSYTATGTYFQTMGIRLLAGRFFDGRDGQDAPKATIVNQTFCRKYFGSAGAVGKTIHLGGEPFKEVFTIVGVIGDVKHGAVDETPHTEAYQSMDQAVAGNATLAVRTTGPVAPLASAMKQIAAELSPSAPPFEVRTMDQLISQSNARRRFQTSLLAIFAAIALTLALVGIYGLMAYAVRQRTPEMGIRMTLGATRAQILTMVLGQGIGLSVAGVVLGLGGALAMTRLLASSLYGVTAADPLTFFAVPALILAVSAAASLVPAWKATRIDPAIALRYE
jgi:putative ABC transport system permease protein